MIYDVPAVPTGRPPRKTTKCSSTSPRVVPDTLGLNTTKGPFEDQKVREAFAYGADREAAVASAFEGKVPYNGNGALSQTTPNFNPNLEDTWPYNPEKAEQLLDQAGWKKGSDGIRKKTASRSRSC